MFKKIRAKKSLGLKLFAKRIIRPTRYKAACLGQNFLTNKSKLRKIADALDLKKGETIVEIGPGHGELTEQIIGKLDNLGIGKYKIILIEKDSRLIGDLKNKFQKNKNIEVVEGDALKVLKKPISQLSNSPIAKYKIVGNIPYYITGHLLRIISELKSKPEIVVLLIQKEVAQRIALRPALRRGLRQGEQAQGKQNMNLLAASVQFWAEPKIIDYVSKRDFKPAPKVDSAIIKLQTTGYKLQTNSKKYYEFIRILFKQPRKTILNNLFNADLCGFKRGLKRINSKKEFIKEKLIGLGINPIDRPQTLNIERIIELSTLF